MAIVPICVKLGEGNHKGLPLHYITVCRGNPTCKALNLMALRFHLGLLSRVANYCVSVKELFDFAIFLLKNAPSCHIFIEGWGRKSLFLLKVKNRVPHPNTQKILLKINRLYLNLMALRFHLGLLSRSARYCVSYSTPLGLARRGTFPTGFP